MATSDAQKRVSLFGKYELLDRLAVGGMAEIFLARSASLGGVVRTCVIKRILPQHCANRHFVSMFIDEARIMIGLDHPNLVKLLDFGQIAGAYFMALEYINGFDLVAVMRKVTQAGLAVDPRAAAYITRAMASALDHAHRLTDHMGRPLEIVHRDISPHNVLLSFVGDVKITDFGIALAKNKLTHTQPGTVMGKFAYMSPEQALAENVDARSDLFSLGVVMHEMLTGQRLFGADTPLNTITKVIEDKIAPPSWVCDQAPEALDAIVLKALRRSPARRFQTGAEMVAALTLYLEDCSYDQSDLADYLNALELTEERERLSKRRKDPTVRATITEPTLDSDRVLKELHRKLSHEPSLWTLMAIGERWMKLGERVQAMAVLRCTAALFAHRGLLVQALVALEPLRYLCDEADRRRDLLALATLARGSRLELRVYLAKIDGLETFEMMRRTDPLGLGDDKEDATVLPSPTPLLGYVEPEIFVELAEVARIRQVAIGETLVAEGEISDCLYAVGRGRVVVYCQAPEGDTELGDAGRINLSSLSEGDFFGEFSFLTGSPRSATVEAIAETWVLELQRSSTDRLMELTSEVAGALLDFYTERIAELLMAKSPVFAVLDPHQRKVLLAHAQSQCVSDGSVIVREGDDSDAFYFIKQGEVEVYSERDSVPIFLNKLVEGEFFGEIGVVQEVRRTANVRAIGEVELMRIDRPHLYKLMLNQPSVAEALREAARERRAETKKLIADHIELLGRL